MPIYDLSGVQKASQYEEVLEIPSKNPSQGAAPVAAEKRHGGWLSPLVARLFFVALLLLDIAWGCYSLVMLLIASLGAMISFGRVSFFQRLQSKYWLAIKRSLVCALALVTAVFSPAFGIMIACTYFLMYDKTGIEEIVPESLQDQFREFFNTPEK